MGADYYAFIDCPLQRRLTRDGFRSRVKLRVMLEGLEARRAEIEAATGRPLEESPMNMGGTNNPAQKLTYAEMRAAAADVASGIPECSTCAVSRGKPVGCYRYVTYPVDAACEELLLEYFVAMLDHPRPEDLIGKDPSGRQYTAADLIFDLVIAPHTSPTPWHTQRGPAERGGVAERPTSVSLTLASRGSTLDSAQVLRAVFTPIDGAQALQLMGHLLRGFCYWAAPDPRARTSRTFREIRGVTELLLGSVGALKQGPVDVIVDA